MHDIAREYVTLVLSLGHHDKNDADYGPTALEDGADKANLGLDAIGSRAADVIARSSASRRAAIGSSGLGKFLTARVRRP